MSINFRRTGTWLTMSVSSPSVYHSLSTVRRGMSGISGTELTDSELANNWRKRRKDDGVPR